jgi:hypothetical protein
MDYPATDFRRVFRSHDLLPFVELKSPYGIDLPCVNLAKLIEIKRAAGRSKDLKMIAELEIIRQEQDDR